MAKKKQNEELVTDLETTIEECDCETCGKDTKASKVLGITSIVLGVLMPYVGMLLGIIGLSIKKSKLHRDRDIALNIIGIGVSFFFWLLYVTLLI